MAVTVRTNRATNPSVGVDATNWAAVAGTGGTASGARNSGDGYVGAGFYRVTWSAATTAISGGLSYTQTGLSESTFYQPGVWVRASKAQTVVLSVAYRDTGLATVNSITGAAVAVPANTWTLVTAPGSSGAAVTSAVYTVAVTTGGSLWASGDTFDGDAVLVEAPAVLRKNLFNGSTMALGAGATLTTGVSYDGSTWTRVSATSANEGLRSFTNLADLVNGSSYAAEYEVANDGTTDVGLSLDWCDNIISGGFHTIAAGVRKRIKVIGSKATYDSTFRFSDLTLNTANTNILVRAILIEKDDVQGPYFDGSTAAPGDGTAYFWTGAANNSTSVQAPVLGGYFDGSSPAAFGVMYAWTGTSDASTSTATTYTPVLTLLVKRDTPTDRVEVTITDLTPTENVCTLWRAADGKRQAVRSFRDRPVTGSDFVEDFEAALGRTLTYELEVTAGVGAGAPSSTAATSIPVDPADAFGWIQDPLDPATALKIYGDVGPNGEPALKGSAIKSLEYAANVSIIEIMGSPDPVALIGQRRSASGVSFAMVTDAAQQAADLRRLLLQAPLLLVRPDPAWGAALPGLCYIAPGAAKELPIDEAWGGSLINWELESPLVAAPTMNVVIPLWTYGDVAALWDTYEQAQTALSGKTYLEVRKSPNGA